MGSSGRRRAELSVTVVAVKCRFVALSVESSGGIGDRHESFLQNRRKPTMHATQEHATEEHTTERKIGQAKPRTCPACGEVISGQKLPVHLRRFCEVNNVGP